MLPAGGRGRGDDATVVTRVVRGRQAGRAIVNEATASRVEVIMMGVTHRRRGGERIFDHAVEFVLRHAPCRVAIPPPPHAGLPDSDT